MRECLGKNVLPKIVISQLSWIEKRAKKSGVKVYGRKIYVQELFQGMCVMADNLFSHYILSLLTQYVFIFPAVYFSTLS